MPEPGVAPEPVASPEPVAPESVASPEPVVAAEPVVDTDRVAEIDPDAYEAIATAATPPVVVTEPPALVSEPIVAAAEAVTSAAESIAEAVTAPPDTVPTITAEAVPPAAASSPTKATLTQGMKTMMKSTEDLVAFGQANLEAFVKSGQIWSAGVQELTKQIATSAKASFDESVSTFKAISTAKSVKEAIDLQSTFAKAALEKAMAESNKLTDASIKLTEQTLAPITARVTVAVETFGKTH